VHAFSILERSRIPVVIVNGADPENIIRAASGAALATVVGPLREVPSMLSFVKIVSKTKQRLCINR